MPKVSRKLPLVHQSGEAFYIAEFPTVSLSKCTIKSTLGAQTLTGLTLHQTLVIGVVIGAVWVEVLFLDIIVLQPQPQFH